MFGRLVFDPRFIQTAKQVNKLYTFNTVNSVIGKDENNLKFLSYNDLIMYSVSWGLSALLGPAPIGPYRYGVVL